MPLLTSDIKVFKSANISDTTANGGVITNMELVDVVGALFPNVDDAERQAGSTKWRKIFFKLVNNGNLPLVGARVYQDQDTTGTDTILFGAATVSDTQGDISPSIPLYCSVPLAVSVLAGGTIVQVTLPTGIDNFFKVGNTLRVTNKAAIDTLGNEEFVGLTDMAVNGSTVSLTVSPPLSNNYQTTNTRVMNVLSVGDLVALAKNPILNSASGTFDITKVTCNNLSTVDTTWTLTFTSSSSFTASSSVVATPVVGNIISPFTVTNPTTTTPYLTIDPAAFSGTFTTGDTVSFSTSSATVPLWLKRVIPANAAPAVVNTATFVLDGGTV